MSRAPSVITRISQRKQIAQPESQNVLMLVMKLTLGQIPEGLTGSEARLKHLEEFQPATNPGRIKRDGERAATAMPQVR